jgi:hypothetical protein
MKNIACYDNQGKTLDRYTVVFLKTGGRTKDGILYEARGMNADPYRGIGYWCTARRGRHLGKRIAFEDLPRPCQSCVLNDLKNMEA